MKIIPIKNGPACFEHAFYSRQAGDLSQKSNPPATWYLEIGRFSLWLCDGCRETLNRITQEA